MNFILGQVRVDFFDFAKLLLGDSIFMLLFDLARDVIHFNIMIISNLFFQLILLRTSELVKRLPSIFTSNQSSLYYNR